MRSININMKVIKRALSKGIRFHFQCRACTIGSCLDHWNGIRITRNLFMMRFAIWILESRLLGIRLQCLVYRVRFAVFLITVFGLQNLVRLGLSVFFLTIILTIFVFMFSTSYYLKFVTL